MRALALLLLLASPAWAGRDFDGTNDEIAFGSDASIDNKAVKVFCMWVRVDSTGALTALATKGALLVELFGVDASDRLRYISDWTTDGTWVGTSDTSAAIPVFRFACGSYNNSGTANDATLFLECTGETLTTDTNPTGTWVADAANELQLGETNSDAQDFNGNIAAFQFDETPLNAARCNRHMWWGRGHGGILVYHPFWTTKLTNEGVAVANGTATGTTVISSPVHVVRPGIGLMNGGTGW